MGFPKGTPIDWSWLNIAPEDMANVEVGDLKEPTKPLDMAGQKITTLPTPTTGSEPATMDFVEGLIQGLDWQQSVLGELDTPPGTPAEGDRYLVIATATGDWVGKEDDIAEWDGTAWDFFTPNLHWTVSIEDVSRQKTFNGTAWVFLAQIIDHGSLIGLADDDHPQYLDNARHDLTERHTLGDVVPHDNLADLLEKAHASLSGIGTSDHHAKTGNYEVFPNTELVTAVPAPAAGNVGRIMRERASAGEVTIVKLCVENSADGYEWIQIGIST